MKILCIETENFAWIEMILQNITSVNGVNPSWLVWIYKKEGLNFQSVCAHLMNKCLQLLVILVKFYSEDYWLSVNEYQFFYKISFKTIYYPVTVDYGTVSIGNYSRTWRRATQDYAMVL